MELEDNNTEILIVDDSLQYSQILQKLLTTVFGYRNVCAVGSVEEASALIAEQPQRFKLFFVDYNLPNGRTGSEFLGELKDKRLLEESVAFLITADPTVDNLREAKSQGALGVVAKPFDRNELFRQINKAKRALQSRLTESF